MEMRTPDKKKRMMQTYMTLFNVTNSSQQLGVFLLESVVQIMMMTLNTVLCMGVFGKGQSIS